MTTARSAHPRRHRRLTLLSPARRLGLLLRAAPLALLAPALLAPVPAAAQFTRSYKFLQAIKDNDAQAVQDALSDPGSPIVNTRDVTSGDTALILVTRRRDFTYISFLLGKGADPNIANNRGETPLTIAASLDMTDAVDLLLKIGARADEPNATGETPLIAAVLRRDLPMVRVLLAGGAQPERTDSSGRSARDYAATYGKDSAIAMAVEAAAKSRAASAANYGPHL